MYVRNTRQSRLLITRCSTFVAPFRARAVFLGFPSLFVNVVIQSRGISVVTLLEGSPRTCENLLYSSGYDAPVHLRGRPGRPQFDINREQLEYFLFYDLGVQDIADAISVSKSTVQQRFREYRISVSLAMSQQTDDQLDDIVR